MTIVSGMMIVSGHIARDHVHLLLSCPPTLASSKVVRYLTGSKFEVVAGGTFAMEEEVLGAASLGSRIFLCDGRECNGRNDQGIHRSTQNLAVR